MRWVTLGILSVIYVVYLLVGAAIFMAIENDSFKDPVYVTESDIFTNFIAANPCVTTDEAYQFATSIIDAKNAGQLSVTNTTSEGWSFTVSVFFVVTAVTTVGYGNIAPTSVGGKIFFFLYALHGIPLTAVLLIGISERLVAPYQKFERRRFTANHPKCELYAKRAVSLVVTYSLFSLIPALVFMEVEGWTFVEAWYFTMVTLTTVGFGDYIPANNDGALASFYKVLVCLWLFLGLAWLSCLLSIISSHMTETSKAIDKKIEDECTLRCPKPETNGDVKQDNKDDRGFTEVQL